MDVTIASGIFAAAGIAVGAGIAWGAVRTRQGIIMESHENLKKDYIKHKENSTIHIDPQRDARTAQEFRQMVRENFADIKEQLEEIKESSQKRLEGCTSQFNKINNRISAITGKPNGGT